MNEIEQAINQLIDLRIDRASFFGGEGTEIYQADVAALDVALAALREKLERERGRKVINARTDKSDEWKNPFSLEDITNAISAIRRISHKDLWGDPYDLLTAFEALNRQRPKEVLWKHKEGEAAALITCPVCEHNTIVNWELHRQFYPEWYCKHCGQRLHWGEATK